MWLFSPSKWISSGGGREDSLLMEQICSGAGWMLSILMIGIREGCEVFDYRPMGLEVATHRELTEVKKKGELFQHIGFVRVVIVGVMRR